MTYAQMIGRILGISRERVYQLERKALVKLRCAMRGEKVKPKQWLVERKTGNRFSNFLIAKTTRKVHNDTHNEASHHETRGGRHDARDARAEGRNPPAHAPGDRGRRRATCPGAHPARDSQGAGVQTDGAFLC